MVMVEYGVDQDGIVNIKAWNRNKIKNEQVLQVKDLMRITTAELTKM